MNVGIGNSVLAMYDIRGKQEFIFRTNKLKEIAGGSWLIRDCFNDYLFDAAKEMHGSKGIFYYKDRDENGDPVSGADFTEENYVNHLKAGYIGEVVYDGGGNFLLLMRDEDTFKEVTYRFTRRLMEEIGTLRVLGSCVQIKDLSDYQGDNARLREIHRRHEMEESIVAPWSCLPIVQVDRQTSQPLVYADKRSLPDDIRYGKEKYSRECLAKRAKYSQVLRAAQEGTAGEQKETAERYFIRNEKIFDNLVEEKGEDSLLAVIYIDGNRMGAKVQECLNGKDGGPCKSYEDCVRELRSFSQKIQDIYVNDGIQAALKDSDGKPQNDHRLVVYAGDEVNFVVNAHDAYDCAKRYLDSLPAGNSACAGIAVFHSHAPYADAYSIAEECCESGKREMKRRNQEDACYIDWHICQGGMGISLEQIRKDAGEGMLSRPWLFAPGVPGSAEMPVEQGEAEALTTTGEVEELAAFFRTLGRNNVKDLASLSQKGSSELSMDLMRIKSHSMAVTAEFDAEVSAESAESERQTDGGETKERLSPEQIEACWAKLGLAGRSGWKLVGEHERRLVYDTVLSYDLWFRGKVGDRRNRREGRGAE